MVALFMGRSEGKERQSCRGGGGAVGELPASDAELAGIGVDEGRIVCTVCPSTHEWGP